MGVMVIVAYKPKEGHEDALLALTREHVPALRQLGFVTDRPALAMQAKDGSIVEVFEWTDGAIEKAHTNPEVLSMWEKYAEVCDYVPIKNLAEAGDMFAEFAPIEL